MELEKILADLKGISVFEHEKSLVSHIKETLHYPSSGIKDVMYHSHISREWSSDNDCPGQGAGDWYECECITQQYFFVENVDGAYVLQSTSCMDESIIVDDVKRSLETKKHKLAYVIKRDTVDGPNWGWFKDTVYVLS